MSNMNLITSLLHLPENALQKLDASTFLLTLPVAPHICPRCHATTSKVHSYRNQPVKTALFCSSGYSLVYRKRRYICPCCRKAFFETNSFLSRYQRMTKVTIAQIIQDHGYLTSSSDIAQRYGVSTSTVMRLFKSVAPGTKHLSSAISIDEFKGNTGAKFQVVIHDLTTYQCLNIIEDRTPDILYSKILEYPLEERLKVRHVSIDLSLAFRKMVQECFPNAQIAADKFHVVRLANDALDSIRKEVQKNLPKEQRRYFKRSRYLLLSREKNLRKEEDLAALQVILNYSDDLSAAYAMKEVYFNLMDSKDSQTFSSKLKQFQLAVEKQESRPFKRLLKTTLAWKKEILHGIATGLNNGFTEGCNTTIKNLKRICYSFRNFDNFRRRILYLLTNPDRCKRRIARTCRQICA